MIGVISSNFDLMVLHGKLIACIEFLEEGLRSLRRTPYHCVLGCDFLHHTSEAANYLIDFYNLATARKKIAALYFEMNAFSINTDWWFCDGFAYRKVGDDWDLDWLSMWNAVTEQQFTLKGMESLQEVFANLYCDNRQPLGVQMAGELAEHLVTARFMQLIAAAHKAAKRRCKELKGLPVLATAHDWDTVHQTK